VIDVCALGAPSHGPVGTFTRHAEDPRGIHSPIRVDDRQAVDLDGRGRKGLQEKKNPVADPLTRGRIGASGGTFVCVHGNYKEQRDHHQCMRKQSLHGAPPHQTI